MLDDEKIEPAGADRIAAGRGEACSANAKEEGERRAQQNGRALAHEVVKRRPGMKVLFTSGYTEAATSHHGRPDPGVLLLAKPYSKAEIARMIRRALTIG